MPNNPESKPPSFPDLTEIIIAETQRRFRECKTSQEFAELLSAIRAEMAQHHNPAHPRKHGSGEYPATLAINAAETVGSYRAAIEFVLRQARNRPMTPDEIFLEVQKIMPEAKIGSVRPEVTRQAKTPNGLLRRENGGRVVLRQWPTK
jgi:hypothetical protein